MLRVRVRNVILCMVCRADFQIKAAMTFFDCCGCGFDEKYDRMRANMDAVTGKVVPPLSYESKTSIDIP